MSWKPGFGNAVTIGNGGCSVPQSKKKKTTANKKAARSSRASWSEGERRIDRMAAKAGARPIGDIADLAFLTPEEGEEFMKAIQQVRGIDEKARESKNMKRKRAPKRA